MVSGLPNDEKSKIRQLFAEGKCGRDELLEAEARVLSCARHLHLLWNRQFQPDADGDHGSPFAGNDVHQSQIPLLRDEVTAAAARRALAITALGNDYTPIGRIIDERAIVNGVVGLLATGGSTNHTIHLIAMAAAAGIALTWNDFNELSRVVPLLTRIYPNGKADVNHFNAAGGMGFLIGELLAAGLLHGDVAPSGYRPRWLSDRTQDRRRRFARLDRGGES